MGCDGDGQSVPGQEAQGGKKNNRHSVSFPAAAPLSRVLTRSHGRDSGPGTSPPGL